MRVAGAHIGCLLLAISTVAACATGTSDPNLSGSGGDGGDGGASSSSTLNGSTATGFGTSTATSGAGTPQTSTGGGVITGGNTGPSGAGSTATTGGDPNTFPTTTGNGSSGGGFTTSGSSGGGSCAHDVCVSGAGLTPDCSDCADTVCAGDSYCCSKSWDSACVDEAAQQCNVDCGSGSSGASNANAGGSTDETWTDLYNTYFGPSGSATCSGGSCHSNSKGGFKCGTSKTACYQGMVDSGLVTPGSDAILSAIADPDYSPLCGNELGGDMPMDCTHNFSSSDVEKLNSWLAAGAADD